MATNKPNVIIPAFGNEKFELIEIVTGTAKVIGKDKPFFISVDAIEPTNKAAREMMNIETNGDDME